MNDPRLDALLRELYAEAPELRTHDAEVRRAVALLLDSRPDASADSRFVDELRRTISARAVELRAASHVIPHTSFMKRLYYLVPGLAVVAIAAIGVLTVGPITRTDTSKRVASESNVSVERLASRAFGELAYGSAPAAADPTSSFMRDQAGGGIPSTAAVPVAPPPMTDGDAAKMMVLPPDWKPTIYRYTFDSPLPELPAMADVLKRLHNSSPPAGAFNSYDLGLLDLGRLRGAKLQNFTLAEEGDLGYSVNVSPEEGVISMYEHGQKWYPAEGGYTPLTIEQMPSDAEVIGIADAFLATYGIDKSSYGTPSVNSDWRIAYAAATDASMRWVPDAVTVTYPYLANGQPAYDDGGQPYGLTVNVNARLRRASGFYNLNVNRFQASAYETETSADRLVAFAREGGLLGDSYVPEGAVTVELALGAPTLGYVRTWQWQTATGEELLVPALIFPVLNAPPEHWRKQIIVPLVKDLLKRPEVMPIDGGAVPMPISARPLMR